MFLTWFRVIERKLKARKPTFFLFFFWKSVSFVWCIAKGKVDSVSMRVFISDIRYFKQKCFWNKTKRFFNFKNNKTIKCFWDFWFFGLTLAQITLITQTLKKLRGLNWVKSNPITQNTPFGLNLTQKFKNYGKMIKLRKNI